MSRDGASGAPGSEIDTRGIDDPARLAEEARDQREKMAAELRAVPLAIVVEPAATYRP